MKPLRLTVPGVVLLATFGSLVFATRWWLLTAGETTFHAYLTTHYPTLFAVSVAFAVGFLLLDYL